MATTPRVLILRTAGTNCDAETKHAFEVAGAKADLVHVNRLREGRFSLRDYQMLAIPGGFSYGDDIAAGRVLANELTSALAEEISEFVRRGNLMIGICNGFQVMVKTGLLPAALVSPRAVTTTLAPNDSGRFEDRWVYLRSEPSRCVWTQGLGTIYLPIAHGEGKFLARESGTVERLERSGQVALRYVGPSGGPAAGYPWNPNGSTNAIAGVCDPSGRLFGLMPHPERHLYGYQHPRWTREGLKRHGDGFQVFRNGVEFARRNLA